MATEKCLQTKQALFPFPQSSQTKFFKLGKSGKHVCFSQVSDGISSTQNAAASSQTVHNVCRQRMWRSGIPENPRLFRLLPK
jgi:hypothetical protein